MRFSDELLAAIDRNVDAMFIAHGLDGLPRDEAFRVADSVEFVGLEQWEDFEIGQHWLHPSVMPIAERIPRSAWPLWYRRYWGSDIALGGYPTDSETHTEILGWYFMVEHATGRIVNNVDTDSGAVPQPIDILPSLELRAESMSRTVWVAEGKGIYGRSEMLGFYVFKPDAEFLGFRLNENGVVLTDTYGYCQDSYRGIGREGLFDRRETIPEVIVAEAFYQSRGLPVGHAWTNSLKGSQGS
jgi:hypothetical protein